MTLHCVVSMKNGGPNRTNKHPVEALTSESNPIMMIKLTVVSNDDEKTSILCDEACICLRGKLHTSTGLMLSIFSPSSGPGHFLFVPFNENHGRKGELAAINDNITKRNSFPIPKTPSATPKARVKPSEQVHIPKYFIPLDVFSDIWSNAKINNMSNPQYRDAFAEVVKVQKTIQESLKLSDDKNLSSQETQLAVVFALVKYFNDNSVATTFIKSNLVCSYVSYLTQECVLCV